MGTRNHNCMLSINDIEALRAKDESLRGSFMDSIRNFNVRISEEDKHYPEITKELGVTLLDISVSDDEEEA